MKKFIMTFALLCTFAQGTWAEDVNYIYYKVIDVGYQASLFKQSGTANNPKVLTSSLLENSSEDNIDTGWYVLNSTFTYGERIVISGDVKLILKDGCTLTAEQGIRINTDATLTIYAQSEGDGMGKLVAVETHHDKAAIGGNKNYLAGRLSIHGGEIDATCNSGSKYAAGIGGGYGDGSGMREISIYGGKVKATGAQYGAGIGGGKNNNHPGTITIYGGTVNASGGEYGAGIGGGENRAGWTTRIYGGNITTTGGNCGAGIGGGEDADGGTLYFYGGTVYATGGQHGAGIGGGWKGDGGTITIGGGNITGKGKDTSAGIGGGRFGSAGTITINGGTVTAEAGSYLTVVPEPSSYPRADEYEGLQKDVYHIPAMMGYGAGSDEKGTVTIGNGATVHLSTTNEYEDGYATGIGCATLTLGSNIKVSADGVYASPTQRVSVCTMKSSVLDIETCINHNVVYAVTETSHTANCRYCEYTSIEAHSIVAPNTKCEKCGFGDGTIVCTLSFPQTSTVDVSGYATAGFQAVQGQTIAMPECTNVPEGWKFVGWLSQSNAPVSIEASDSETTLLQSGDEYVVTANEMFFARYRRVFTETWQWWIGDGGDQVAVTVNDGSGSQQITANVTSQTMEATGALSAYTVYTATATYKPDNTTYTFTDKRVVVNITTVELDETDNTMTLADHNGDVVNVILAGRTLYRDGSWNTLCLPFDATVGEGTPLEGAIVKELTDASVTDGTLTLTFSDASSIKAGRPYLVKWDKADGYDTASEDSRDIKNPVFNGVTIANSLSDDDISVDGEGTATVTFMGTYKQQSYTAADHNVLFLNSDNTLYYPQSEVSIGAQCGYFKLNGLTAGDSSADVHAFVLDFGDSETTGIVSMDNGQLTIDKEADGWYSLDGSRLIGKPATKGIYIHNGHKVVIK